MISPDVIIPLNIQNTIQLEFRLETLKNVFFIFVRFTKLRKKIISRVPPKSQIEIKLLPPMTVFLKLFDIEICSCKIDKFNNFLLKILIFFAQFSQFVFVSRTTLESPERTLGNTALRTVKKLLGGIMRIDLKKIHHNIFCIENRWPKVIKIKPKGRSNLFVTSKSLLQSTYYFFAEDL
jgi:hypothetical protein